MTGSKAHEIAAIGFERHVAVVEQDREIMAELWEIEESFQAIQMDVPGVVEGIGAEIRVVPIPVFVEAEPEVALIDDVVGREALLEAATVGLRWIWIAASAVGGITLDPQP